MNISCPSVDGQHVLQTFNISVWGGHLKTCFIIFSLNLFLCFESVTLPRTLYVKEIQAVKCVQFGGKFLSIRSTPKAQLQMQILYLE